MYPQNQGYPQQPGYVMPNTYPGQPGYQTGYPQPGYPQSGYPPPQGGYPQPGFNQGGYPRDPNVTVHIDPNSGGGTGGGWQGASASGLFSEKATRNAFVSKVYTILSGQLTFTVLLISIFVFNPDTKSYFAKNQAWLFLGMAIFFISFLILVCVQSSRRSFPTNFILLAILTFGMGFEAAVISCRYDTKVVLYAAFTCAVSTIVITMFAKYTSFDMTSCGTVLCVLSLIHMVVGMVLMIALGASGQLRLASLIMAIFGAFLVMLYLIYDTQLIMGGRKEEISPEEYILGAILLYVDIVQMFLFLLEIFQRMGDE